MRSSSRRRARTSCWTCCASAIPSRGARSERPSGAAGRVAVAIQATPEDQAALLRLEAFGLTAREREVATLIAQDLGTATIAERLFISPWTVQDHCKAIFEKTGTGSRRELRALIFFHDHLPAIAVRTPLDAGGHLDVAEPRAGRGAWLKQGAGPAD